MQTKITRILMASLSLAAFTLASTATAANLELSIFDQRNTPLADAVVTLSRDDMPASTAPAGSVEIQQINQEFVPEVTVVRAGTAVNFPNNDDILHHVYSFSESKTFDLPLYTGTPSDPVVFDQAGLVTLGCNIHDWMRAYVVVVDTPYYQASSADGKVRFGDLPDGEYQLEIWHPQQRSAYAETIRVSEATRLDVEIPVKPQLRSRRDASGAGGGYR